jgi:thiol-disulfide isomerase/thioredoxin
LLFWQTCVFIINMLCNQYLARIFFLAICFLPLHLPAQDSIYIALQKDVFSATGKMAGAHFINPAASFQFRDTSFLLQHNERIVNPVVFRLYVQEDSARNIHEYFYVISGASDAGDILMVADQNRDKIFSNDPVYRIPMQQGYNSEAAYMAAAPFVLLKSVTVYDAGSVQRKADVMVKMAPAPGYGDHYFKNTRHFATTKKQYLQLYNTINYTGQFRCADTNYTFTFTPYPLLEPLLPYLNIYERHSFGGYGIRKNTEGIAGHTPNWGIFQNLLLKRDPGTSFITLGNTKYTVARYSWDSLYVLLKKVPAFSIIPHPGFNISKAGSYNIRTGMRTSLLSGRNRHYTLLLFSGSWCVPCHEALPALKQIFAQYGHKVHFITIAAENNPAAARRYLRSSHIPWAFFYEPLHNSRLLRELSVAMYPDLLLFSPSGELLFRTHSSDAPAALQQQLKILLQ